MQKMNDLRDLLTHEIQDLYSAEEQIIEALPKMIDKAKNPQLKKSLKEHLKVTEKHRDRLQQVQQTMGNQQRSGENPGLLSRLFKGRQTCRGMQGIIEEGAKVMGENMDPDVMDAAIIACAQKVEHYEICGYGTARSFARELGLTEVEQLLQQTLNEEYMADDLLTQIAESRVNKDAETKGAASGNLRSSGSRTGSTERVREEESELELVSKGRSRAAGTGNKASATGSRSGSPSGSASRSNVTSNRTSSGNTTKRNTSGSAGSSGTSRSSSASTGRTGSNGRGTSGSSGRRK